MCGCHCILRRMVELTASFTAFGLFECVLWNPMMSHNLFKGENKNKYWIFVITRANVWSVGFCEYIYLNIKIKCNFILMNDAVHAWRTFSALFARAYLFLDRIISVQTTPYYYVELKSILISSSNLYPSVQSGVFPSGSFTKTLYTFLPSTDLCNPISICKTITILKYSISQSSSLCRVL